MRYIRLSAILLFATVLTACEITPASSGRVAAAPADNIVYFDFDRSDVRVDGFATLDASADFILASISKDSGFAVVVEGHCDERGTEQYNIALGNRRAEAVARYLRVKGVPAGNIRTESYGESRPAASGSNESAWSRNRRAVLVYQ